MLWPDLHLESFAGTAWDVTLQSSCKISYKYWLICSASKAASPAKIGHCKAQQCRGVVESPSEFRALSDPSAAAPRSSSSRIPALQGQGSWASHPSAALLRQGAPWSMCFQGRTGIKHCLVCMYVSRESKSLRKRNNSSFFCPDILAITDGKIN